VATEAERSSSKSPHRNRSASRNESPARSGSRGRSASRQLDVMRAEQSKTHPQTSFGLADAAFGLTKSKDTVYRSKLFEAIDHEDLAQARALMAAGESPQTAFKAAHSSEAMLLLMQGVDKFKLLSTCTKLDQACERIFPKVTHLDYLMIQQVTRGFSTPALDKFARGQAHQKPFNPQHLREVLEKLSRDDHEYDLTEFQTALCETHPTFANAWACANERQRITLVDDPHRTYYSPVDHTIHICVQDSLKGVLEDLFACTLLALSRDIFLEVQHKPVDRETFTLRMTHTIFEAQQRSERELHPYFPESHVSTETFQEHWQKCQGFAQQHRDFWYKNLLKPFLCQNPNFLPARFEQMQKAIKA
ncbi:MAG TPA: hypothetical protein VLG44_05785, partial [Chlamydiales bacterium]|nr:hypothetical protein [Chlamydiales bacterium]